MRAQASSAAAADRFSCCSQARKDRKSKKKTVRRGPFANFGQRSSRDSRIARFEHVISTSVAGSGQT
ncbi:hypothetical protein L596_018582 [Steinernema carpocapsae]|uniref:Uncharacterized protein n=1 Tax=Steinernema carpocapsae TaxID=34508 RepID=A0A4U5N5T4_STECR|nr:hypothetical protein L596_018582 [Steinernema carpocapsae]